jgi:hypothetical protein
MPASRRSITTARRHEAHHSAHERAPGRQVDTIDPRSYRKKVIDAAQGRQNIKERKEMVETARVIEKQKKKVEKKKKRSLRTGRR